MKRNGLNDRVVKEVKTRPLDALIRPKEEVEKEEREKCLSYKVATRKTFLLDPITIEALRIFIFKNRKGLSESVIEMLLKYIPKEIWIEARRNVVGETPENYLEGLEDLDIESIYYRNK